MFRKSRLSPVRSALLVLAVFALSLLWASCSKAPSFYLGGIQVNEPDHDHWVRTLRENKFNTIAATVYAHQGDWDSENLWFDDKNDSVVSEIRAAEAQDVNVVLIMRVALDHAFEKNTFLWHGMIMPKSEEQLAEWFRRYTDFVLKWARIAEKEGVEIFGIGSEMNSLTSTIPVKELPPLLDFYLDEKQQKERNSKIAKKAGAIRTDTLWTRGDKKFSSLQDYLDHQSGTNREWALSVGKANPQSLEQLNARRDLLEKSWRELISKVRKEFSGKLLYAANFDQYHEVEFWDALDYMGINAYFPLRDPNASKTEFRSSVEEGWESAFGQIVQFRKENKLDNKPVIFSELGYTFRKDCTIEPWSSEGFSLIEQGESDRVVFWKEQPIDFEERVLALQALNKASVQHPGVLKGALYWKLSTIKSHLDIEPFVHILSDEKDKAFQQELHRLSQQNG